MTKYYKIFTIIILSVILCTLAYSISVSKIIEKKTFPTESATESVTYCIKEFGGKIGVFDSNAQTPSRIIDINVDELPEGDQKIITEGIVLHSKEDLQKFIEDYES